MGASAPRRLVFACPIDPWPTQVFSLIQMTSALRHAQPYKPKYKSLCQSLSKPIQTTAELSKSEIPVTENEKNL